MAGRVVVSTLNNDTGVLATQNGMTGIAKAWVNFVGSSGTVNASFNVSSVTRASTGQYTVNFTTAMPNANYSFAGSGQRSSGDDANTLIICAQRSSTITTSSLPLFVGTQSAIALDAVAVTLVVFSS